MSEGPSQDINILQLIFASMWKLSEGDPFARKMLTAGAEGYNRQMARINGTAPADTQGD